MKLWGNYGGSVSLHRRKINRAKKVLHICFSILINNGSDASFKFKANDESAN